MEVQVRDYFINTLRPRQNGRHFADDILKWIFLTENVRISINISLKFVPMVQINNIPALVQIMAWRRPGDKPLSEPMMLSLLTHICVTRPQWVNKGGYIKLASCLGYGQAITPKRLIYICAITLFCLQFDRGLLNPFLKLGYWWLVCMYNNSAPKYFVLNHPTSKVPSSVIRRRLQL